MRPRTSRPTQAGAAVGLRLAAALLALAAGCAALVVAIVLVHSALA